MQTVDLLPFFIKGNLFDFDENTSEKRIIEVLGPPDEIEDYSGKGKFFHYNNLRFFLSENRLNGISIFFINSEEGYEVKVDEETFHINKNISLVKILQLLNQLELTWIIPYEQSKLDYLLVEVEKNLKIFYYFDGDCLERISKSFS